MEAHVNKANLIAIAAALALSVASGLAAPQAQAPAAPQGGQGGGGGRGGRGGGQGAPGQAAPAAPARGITINANPIQKAHAEISGPSGVKGTADFVEYAQGSGQMMQVVVNVQGLPPGMHGMHIHSVGKCDAPGFASAGGHFDPGPAGNPDPDRNHPFHSGDLPNLTAAAGGPVSLTTYTTRFNLGGPLSLFDADGSAIVIHAMPDTYSTGVQGSGVGGGNAIACGVIIR
jgi:superoxide dismutase, Cu-Zn family